MEGRTNVGKWVWSLNDTKDVWGPVGWRWLHLQCINYPLSPKVGDRDKFVSRIWGFVTQLPCFECRNHATSYIQDNPPDATNRYTLQSWALTFHNAVNKRLGKKIFTEDDYNEKYVEELRLAMIA